MAHKVSRVVLVGWRGADWKLIHPLLDAGLMPNLRKLVERGSMGTLASTEPRAPSILWTSVATGMTADRHGVHGSFELDPVTGGVRPASSVSRKVKALWNVLHQAGRRSLVVNWPAGHPAEPVRGACVAEGFGAATAPAGAPWDPAPDCIYPSELAAPLADLRVHPGDLTGDDLLPFLPLLASIDQERDPRPAALAGILAENIGVHGAATWLMETREWDFTAVCYSTIGQACRMFMPYQSPRMEGVEPGEFEIYKDVVNGVYSLQDLMLGRLIQLAGPDAAIVLVSEHGYLTGDRRPSGAAALRPKSAASWQRVQGLTCMAGPGIATDELLYGATLLDVAPTVLALLGLPPARICRDAFWPKPSSSRRCSSASRPGKTPLANAACTPPSRRAPPIAHVPWTGCRPSATRIFPRRSPRTPCANAAARTR
jgi:hypothetical protein